MALPINIEDLLNKRKIESNRIEFKKGWNPNRIYRTICAFANDFDNIGGGYILVGVEEENGIAKRPVTGIPDAELDKIQKAMVGFNNKLNPYYMPRIDVEEVDGKNVLAIWVPAGTNRPYDVKESVTAKQSVSKWYIRSGTSSIEAKGEVLDELREMASRVPFDDRGNPDIKLSDLDPLLVQDYLKRVNSKLLKDFRTKSFEEILDQMDLFVGPTERRMIKNVAAMMFCENPAKFFPTTQVDIVIFPEGLEKNPNNMIEVPKIVGPVPYMIKATLDYLHTVVVKERIIKPKDRAESIRFFNYPYQAFEEAVVNASLCKPLHNINYRHHG
jgi:ATP-dependent DNA helicase RecG